MRKNCLIFLSFLLAPYFCLFAQGLNLEEARALALASSRTLARHNIAIQTSVLNERNQLYSMLPQVSASLNASSSYLRNWEFINPIENMTAGVSFSVTQVLFRGGRSFLERAIQLIETESIRLEAMSAYFGVLDSVDREYYSVLEAGAALEAAELSLEAANLSLAIAEIRHQSGILNMGDYLEALAEKEAKENSRNQARRSLTLAKNRFNIITGITEPVELEPVGFENYEEALVFLSSVSDEDSVLLFENFWNLIKETNPSFARAVLNNERAQKNHTGTLRSYAPTIEAEIFSSTFNFLPNNNSRSSGGITLRGSIPLDFWVMTNRIERSRLSLESSAIDFMNAEVSLQQELRSALFDIYSQAENVLSSRRSLEASERRFEFMMERYRLGLSSVSDLNNASSSLMNSRNNLNRSSYSFLRSLSSLRSLCAIDNEEELLSVLIRTWSTD
ncbi:MAG: TolC family protein [Treponema sp.]|nr:TolC family protein [Treponema sp.]MCL2237246.1 TolC family protein [Treponema sp.]